MQQRVHLSKRFNYPYNFLFSTFQVLPPKKNRLVDLWCYYVCTHIIPLSFKSWLIELDLESILRLFINIVVVSIELFTDEFSGVITLIPWW